MTPMSLNLAQVQKYIVEPALGVLELNTPAAVQLVMATGMAESGYIYIDQIDADDRPGPAFGLWQMERTTHDDIWRSFLRFEPQLSSRVRRLMAQID